MLMESMECSLIVSIAPFGPGGPGSSPGWFTVSNLSIKLSFSDIIQGCGTLAS